MAQTVFLQKDDVALRPLETEDAEFLRNLVQRPEVRKYLGRVPEPISAAQEEKRIEKISEDDSTIQFIVEKDGERAGTIMLFDINQTYRRAEFGALMVHPDFQGEGVGTKATEMILEYGFEELNLHRIASGYIEGNEASKRVQEKFGFEEEGRSRDFKFRDGEYLDIIRASLLEHEWRSE